MKLRWIFTGLAASVAILVVAFTLSSRPTRGVVAAMAVAPPEHVTIKARTPATAAPAVRPAVRPAEIAFADRFSGAPMWDTDYTGSVRTEPRMSYASAQPTAPAQRATDAVASRMPTFQLASASASVPVPSEPRTRPTTIASAVAAFSNEPDSKIAIYDIAAHTVYMPNGDRLEAHSGLGSNLDDPGSAKVRMRGVTPPHIYELKLREALFHGVPALRLTPVGGEDAIYGRDGLLAHTFMLGPNGDSNGCVSFRDYYAFLDAYRNKGIKKLAVLARID